MNKQLIKAISELQEDEAIRLVKAALDKGETPASILADCQEAMKIVGDCYEKQEYWLPELIMSGHVLEQISDIVKPKLRSGTTSPSSGKRAGKIILGSVHGDMHDIGKKIVSFMLDVNGFEVHDLGVDVPEEKFVEAVKELKPQVIALSGLLTSVYDSMKSTVDALKKAGLRNKVKIMIGGGQIDERVKEYAGADAYGKDAMAAVLLAKQWMPER